MTHEEREAEEAIARLRNLERIESGQVDYIPGSFAEVRASFMTAAHEFGLTPTRGDRVAHFILAGIVWACTRIDYMRNPKR
jgi:hypothetical protein